MNVSKIAPYAKTVVAICGLIVLAANACADGVVSIDEILSIITGAGVVLGVYQVPNKNV